MNQVEGMRGKNLTNLQADTLGQMGVALVDLITTDTSAKQHALYRRRAR
jgi:hypothetical protein